jgi:ubiquitin-like 1-activating enzyme E1 B
MDETTVEKIKNSKILLIGAGGIGCELLKNLVLSDFGEIDVVSLAYVLFTFFKVMCNYL